MVDVHLLMQKIIPSKVNDVLILQGFFLISFENVNFVGR